MPAVEGINYEDEVFRFSLLQCLIEKRGKEQARAILSFLSNK